MAQASFVVIADSDPQSPNFEMGSHTHKIVFYNKLGDPVSGHGLTLIVSVSDIKKKHKRTLALSKRMTSEVPLSIITISARFYNLDGFPE